MPTSYEALAEFLGTKVALPKRAKGNPWASAQHIESTKHRATVTALLREAFAQPVVPGPLHLYLAGLALPMIVDSWYDGAMRTALAGATNWGEVQGITRAGIGGRPLVSLLWHRASGNRQGKRRTLDDASL